MLSCGRTLQRVLSPFIYTISSMAHCVETYVATCSYNFISCLILNRLFLSNLEFVSRQDSSSCCFSTYPSSATRVGDCGYPQECLDIVSGQDYDSGPPQTPVATARGHWDGSVRALFCKQFVGQALLYVAAAVAAISDAFDVTYWQDDMCAAPILP